MVKENFIQFELWKDCKNGCPFCQNRGLGDVDKLQSLQFIKSKLNSSELDDYKDVGFIGGEFFDGQLDDIDVKLLFYECVDIIADKILKGALQKFYVTATLTNICMNDIIEFIEHIKEKNIIENVLLCTSYDTKYRFNKKTEKIWHNTMQYLQDRYPELNKHIEIIVTEDFAKKMINDEIDLVEISKKYNAYIDFIEPHSGFYFKDKYEFDKHVPDFMLKRKTFLTFLNYMYQKFPNDINTMFNKNLKSNDFYIHYKDGKLIKFENRRTHKDRTCGVDIDHIPSWGYIDSDIDIVDDVEEFKRSVNG